MIAESEKSWPTGMWVIFYRRLDDPNVWKTMRYQRNDGVLVSADTYDNVFKFRRYREAFDFTRELIFAEPSPIYDATVKRIVQYCSRKRELVYTTIFKCR